MGLVSALVDRARLVTQEPVGPRVEGTTALGDVTGEWFKCRLILPAAPETPDEGRGYRRAVSTPQLLVGLKDAVGDPVRLHFDQRVIVESVEQGELSLWRVDGEPQPLRKKRSMIGYLATVERSLEREIAEFVP